MTQNMEALNHANEVRMAGAQVKREIRAGTLAVSEAVTDPRAQVLTVGSLLCAQWRWGRLRASLLLEDLYEETEGPHRVRLFVHQRLRDLTDRQRNTLQEYLRWAIGETSYRPPVPGEGPYLPAGPLRETLTVSFRDWTVAEMAAYAHVEETVLRRVVAGEQQQVSLHQADRILVGLGCPHLLAQLYPEVTA